MNIAVIDASVAAKWFLPAAGETLLEQANHVLAEFNAGRLRLVVPDLFWPELGNILWKAVRMGRLTSTAAEEAISLMCERQLPTVQSTELIETALVIALGFGRTVYDSIYVAAATARNADLITADERLCNAVGGSLPVKWLGLL